VWTPDAVWQVAPTQEFRGVEAICAAVEWQWSAFPQMHHWTANLVIDLDGDEARGEAEQLFSLDPQPGQEPGTPDRHEALGAGSGDPER
jgi:hypothetical protein